MSYVTIAFWLGAVIDRFVDEARFSSNLLITFVDLTMILMSDNSHSR